MPIFDTKLGLKEKITSELERMNEPQILAAASRTKTTCECYTVWEKPPDIKDECGEEIAC